MIYYNEVQLVCYIEEVINKFFIYIFKKKICYFINSFKLILY